MCFCGTTAKARRFSRTVRDSQKKNIPFSFCRGEFGRKGVGGGFFVPEDADDPPAGAVVEKLDAVDAAGEGLFVGSGAGCVAAEDLGDAGEFLDAVGDGAFVESVRFEVAARAACVSFDIEKANRTAIFPGGGGEPGFGDEEGAEAVPITITGGAGDDVVDGFEDGIEGLYVVGSGSG